MTFIMSSFTNLIHEYCEIDNQMKTLRKTLKEHSSCQNELAGKIIAHMQSNNLELCNAGELGIITLRKTNSKCALNKDTIKSGIMKMLTNNELMSKKTDEIAESGSDVIINERETSEKCTLKRTNVKT